MNILSSLEALNYWAVLVAALSTFLVGGLWYSPLLFGKAWKAENGFTEEQLKEGGGMVRIFGTTFLLSLIMATVLALYIGDHFGELALLYDIKSAIILSLGLMAANMGKHYLFERKSMRLFMIHASHDLTAMILMAVIIGLWR